MKNLTLSTNDRAVYKRFLDFDLPCNIDDLKYFHQSGAWMFQLIYEGYGKNLRIKEFPFGYNGIVFDVDSKITQGIFILRAIASSPMLGFEIEFKLFDSFALPPWMQIQIGYHHDSSPPGSFITSKHELNNEHSIPVISTSSLKFDDWIGRNTNFEPEFLAVEILKEVVLPISQKMKEKYGRKTSKKLTRQYI